MLVGLTTNNLLRKAEEGLGFVSIVGANVKNQLAGWKKGTVKPGFPLQFVPPFPRQGLPQPQGYAVVFERVKPAPFQQAFFDPLFHAMLANVFILYCAAFGYWRIAGGFCTGCLCFPGSTGNWGLHKHRNRKDLTKFFPKISIGPLIFAPLPENGRHCSEQAPQVFSCENRLKG